MWTQDWLLAADMHLDVVARQLRELHVVGLGAMHGKAASVREQVRRAGAIVERAHAYVVAARQTVADVDDDLRNAPGRVGDDLRLLGHVCAMVDELGSEAARHLSTLDRQLAADPDPHSRMLGSMLAADTRTLQTARSSAQAAGRIAHELAEELPRLQVATRSLGRDHEHRQLRELALGPTGPPR